MPATNRLTRRGSSGLTDSNCTAFERETAKEVFSLKSQHKSFTVQIEFENALCF
jgi:hypothetical protein